MALALRAFILVRRHSYDIRSLDTTRLEIGPCIWTYFRPQILIGWALEIRSKITGIWAIITWKVLQYAGNS
jgi:hypothetical protein